MQQFFSQCFLYLCMCAHAQVFEREKFSNETTRENHIALQPLTEKNIKRALHWASEGENWMKYMDIQRSCVCRRLMSLSLYLMRYIRGRSRTLIDYALCVTHWTSSLLSHSPCALIGKCFHQITSLNANRNCVLVIMLIEPIRDVHEASERKEENANAKCVRK